MFFVLFSIVVLSGLLAFHEKMRRSYQLKLIEAKKQSQLALEGQRYEKIREILTEGVIDGQPAAMEALKPLVEVIADQMRGEAGLELKELEREHELALAKTQTKPLDSWLEKLENARKACTNSFGEFNSEAYELIVDKMTESTQIVFGNSLQQTLPVAEEKKTLPESTNGQ
jgi:hypothetical protein